MNTEGKVVIGATKIGLDMDPIRKIRLTKPILAELVYKLTIFAEDPDLHESYGFDAGRAEALRDRFARAKPGTFDITNDEAEVISGELENSAEIELANADSFFRGGNHNRAASLRKAAAAATGAQL